jgi:hypothetical protein
MYQLMSEKLIISDYLRLSYITNWNRFLFELLSWSRSYQQFMEPKGLFNPLEPSGYYMYHQP